MRGKSGVDKQLALPPGWCGIGGGVKKYDRRPVPISVDGTHICVVCRVSEAGFAADTGRVLMQHLVIVPHLKPGVIAPAGEIVLRCGDNFRKFRNAPGVPVNEAKIECRCGHAWGIQSRVAGWPCVLGA